MIEAGATFGAMAVAMALDAAIGWPAWLFRRIGHPVTWIGALIDRLDAGMNRLERPATMRRALGAAAALAVIAAATAPAVAVAAALPEDLIGAVAAGVLAWPLLAVRSLHEHVAAVARPLEAGDLAEARRAVSMIVGRDPTELDSAGVGRAAIESLAENASDGVVAPVFWGLIFGLPGVAAYKAVNTLDSMIGHRTARHEAFGWASARIDDAANLVPARLTALLIALVSKKPMAALRTMRRDARRHRSPNAGWPEAAMAGALGVRLSGPRRYGDRVSAEPWVNEGARDPTAADVSAALGVYRRAIVALWAAAALLAVWRG